MGKDFFVSQTLSSRIKAGIVAEYFPKYCRILLKSPQVEIRYMDLFAGPGIYDDGSHSTPMLIAKTCAEDERLRQTVRLVFNDNEYCNILKSNFIKNFPTGTFRFDPRFGDRTVGEDKKITDFLLSTPKVKNPAPTLLFIDPFGYKGINTSALANFLSSWGNELFLFVNVKRIHAATENNKFDELMYSLFPVTIDKLRNDRKYKSSVAERLKLIMDNLAFEFKSIVNSKLYHCSFKFQEEDSRATSHFILHFTKHSKGYELIKDVYHGFDNIGADLDSEGNYTFDSKRANDPIEHFLDFGDPNVRMLADQLKIKFKGRTISAGKLFFEHHVNNQYSKKHYSLALRTLESEDVLISNFTDRGKHKVSVLVNEQCVLQFR